MKLCVLQVGALKLSLRDGVGEVGWGGVGRWGEVGWGLPTFCCNLLRGKTGGKCVSFPHGVAGKKKKKSLSLVVDLLNLMQTSGVLIAFWVHLAVTRLNVPGFAPIPE